MDARGVARGDEAAVTAALTAQQAAKADVLAATKDAEHAAQKCAERKETYWELQEKADRKAKTSRKMLTITVVSATNLVEKDTGMFGDHSDPYVVVIVKDNAEDAPIITHKDEIVDPAIDAYCNDPFSLKTSVVKDNRNPVWNEDFNFERETPDDDYMVCLLLFLFFLPLYKCKSFLIYNVKKQYVYQFHNIHFSLLWIAVFHHLGF